MRMVTVATVDNTADVNYLEITTMAEMGLLKKTEGPKSCRLCIFKEFYCNNFPTATANVNATIPFLAMVLSLTLAYIPVTQTYAYINLMLLIFILIIGGATYQLYYGLQIGDRKQFAPWILLKLIEIIIATSVGTFFLIRHLVDKPFYGDVLNPWKYAIMGYLMFINVINISIYVIVILQWNKLRKQENRGRVLEALKRNFSICGIWKVIKEFYYNNFPSDTASFNVKIPYLAMVCSITFAYIPMSQLYFVRIFCFSYLLVMSGATYQLYCGLKVGDKKQLMPWIVLKSIEIILMASIGGYFFILHLIDAFNHPYTWTYIIISFVSKLAIMNIWIYFVVIGQWKKMKKEENLAKILEVFDPKSVEQSETEVVLTKS